MVMAVHGKNAITSCRNLMGATTGYEAAAGTIRGDFSSSRGFNLVHGSDGEETAKSELELFFAPGELVEYNSTMQSWVLDSASGSPE